MITLRVSRYYGAPQEKPLSATFDIDGGTIGRAPDNTLVLPDPNKRISRLQARVSYDGHGFVIVDEGSNPGQLNGRALARGRGMRISPGDQLVIGSYELVVEEGLTTASGLGLGLEGSTEGAVDDPLQLFGTSRSPAESGGHAGGPRQASASTGSLGQAPPEHTSPSASRPQTATTPIPEDFDPFAPPRIESPLPDSARGGASGDTSSLGIELAPQPSLDDLYHLEGTSQSEPFGPTHPLSPRARDKGGARSDLLPDWDKPAVVTSGSNLAEINEPIDLPRMVREGPASTATPSGGTPIQRETVDPLLLFPQQTGKGGLERAPGPEPCAPEPPAGGRPAQPTAPLGQAERAPAPGRELSGGPAPSREAEIQPVGTADHLLAAFLEGAGVRDLDLGVTVTPALMGLLGQLLKESTQGAYALLHARRLTKHELRLEQTTVEPQENNSLKFSPDPEAALRQLLLPPVRGFMPPVDALRDAFHDLEAHHFGVMAGIRAALGTLLQRFDPEELEQRLGPRSTFDSLLPMNRNAKLWELFKERYQRLRDEAEEDFHSIFGRAFVRAYEEQIERLRSRSNTQT